MVHVLVWYARYFNGFVYNHKEAGLSSQVCRSATCPCSQAYPIGGEFKLFQP